MVWRKIFLIICVPLFKNFGRIVDVFSAGFPKHHSTCPWKKFEGKCFYLINPLSIKIFPNGSGNYLPSAKKKFDGVVETAFCESIGNSLSRHNNFWRIYFLSTFGRWAINSRFFVARSLKTAFYVSIVRLRGKIIMKKLHLFSWFHDTKWKFSGFRLKFLDSCYQNCFLWLH